MALFARKTESLAHTNLLMKGGVIGGKDLRNEDKKGGVYGLNGLTLSFNSAAEVVTFSAGSAQVPLKLKDILDQIAAALSARQAQVIDGNLGFIDVDFSAAIILDADSTAAAALGFTADVFAKGSITAVDGASLVDDETFVLDDGANPAVTFEFDDDGDVVESGTLRSVDFTGADTLNTVRDAIITAIAGAPTLDITASIGGDGLVSLINDTEGVAGNVAITETVVDAGFLVSGMSGGKVVAEGKVYNAPGGGAPELVALGAGFSTDNTYLLITDE